jgi:ribosomal protein S18 acetylase RimI-like enzyme
MAMILIRAYQADLDRREVRNCIAELQDHERRLEPGLPPGEAMADEYLAFLLRRCEECKGEMMLAIVDGKVAGFVCVLTEVPPAEPDESQVHHAYISDLFVHSAYRQRGLGRRLLEEAESTARSRGATELRVGVLAKNRLARELYEELGFIDYQVQLVKSL